MKNLRGDILAGSSVALLGGTIWALFYVDFPDGGKDVLLVVIGVLTTVVKDVYSFEFGNSKSGERSAQAVVETMKDGAAKREAAPAVTPAPMNPATGITPAVEVATQPPKGTP